MEEGAQAAEASQAKEKHCRGVGKERAAVGKSSQGMEGQCMWYSGHGSQPA